MNDDTEIKNDIEISDVNEAITNVLKGGQSYKIASRSLTRADLKELRQMRTDLAAEDVANNSIFGRTFVAGFDRR